MSDRIPPTSRLIGKNNILVVELGSKSRPFKKEILLGKHWLWAKASEGTLVFPGECFGPLKIKPILSGSNPQSIILKFVATCKKCGLSLQFDVSHQVLSRQDFNFQIVRWIRDTLLARHGDLNSMNLITRFVECSSLYPIGCLLLKQSELKNNTYLGLVTSDGLAAQAIAAQDFLLSQIREQSQKASKAMADLMIKIQQTIDPFAMG